jgi:RNA polymerase sigma-70 factor (ECF subfamily)
MLAGVTSDALQAAHDRALRAWPGVRLDIKQLEAHLARLGCAGPLPAHVSDVYLACACSQGDPVACRLFEARFAADIRAAAGRLCTDPALREEVVQQVRHKLLVGEPPGLAKYTGEGSLSAWLRAVARRAAIDALRARKQRETGRVSNLQANDSSIESRIDRARFLSLFERCLGLAFSALPARDRNLLRMHYAGSVGIDALGRAYGVHRATAARWLVAIRAQLSVSVRAQLEQSVGSLSDAELRDLVRLTAGQLSVALSRWDADSRASMLGLWADQLEGAEQAEAGDA